MSAVYCLVFLGDFFPLQEGIYEVERIVGKRIRKRKGKVLFSLLDLDVAF
jgi:hypothetical protein